MASSSAKYTDSGNSSNAMVWPTDIFAVYLGPEVPASFGENTTPDKESRNSTRRVLSQELSTLVWGSCMTALCMLLFQVGYTNKLAVGLWTPAVILSLLVAFAMTKLKNGNTKPLLVWHLVISIAFQVTLMLSVVKCLVLEASGSRSFTVVVMSLMTMMGGGRCITPYAASAASAAAATPSPPSFLPKAVNTSVGTAFDWAILSSAMIVQLMFYLIFGLIDAFASCTFSTDDLNFSSFPRVAVIQLFQQIVPVIIIVGSCVRVYAHNLKVEQQSRISEEFALKCLRATVQRDVNSLVLATEEYDNNPPRTPSIRDDALHMVISFLHTVVTQPTLVAQQLTPIRRSLCDDAVRPLLIRTSSNISANKSPLHQLKVAHLAALNSTSDNDTTDNKTNENPFQETLPDKYSNTAAEARDVRRAREKRLGSIHGNLVFGVNGLMDTPTVLNSGTPTRPSTSASNALPVGIAPHRAYFVLFALPKLSMYLMSSQSSTSMAEMFLGEFAEVVQEVMAKWNGTYMTSGFNYVIAEFSNLTMAVAATVEAQAKMANHAGHHKDITLNMLNSHRLLTMTVVGEALFGRPVSESKWAFGYSAVERVFDSAIQVFATREPLPANIISTNLTGSLGVFFETRPCTIHTTLMTVVKAWESVDGVPVLPDSVLTAKNAKKESMDDGEEGSDEIELLDLPILEVAIAKNYNRGSTAADGSRAGLHKTKSLAHRPPSGRTQSAAHLNKPRKGLPAQVLEVWNTIDMDGNGYLDLQEMETLIKKIGLPMSKIEIREFFKKIDVDGSGSLTIDEFEDAYYSTTLGGATVISSIRRAAMAMAHSNEKEFIGLVEKSWRKYDRDNSGKLDQVEVGNILKDIGMNHTPEEIKWMFDRMDKDKSGFVEFDEFMTLFAADTSEFQAVRERIQAVGRVMNKSSATFSTTDQATRDFRVKVLEWVNAIITPYVFVYIWYMFCSTSYYITLGPDLAPVTLTQSIINIMLDAIYAAWCIAKLVYLPKENRGSVTFKQVWKVHIRTTECWVDMVTIIPADFVYFALGSSLGGGLISYYRANKLLCLYHLDERYKLLTEKFNPAISRAANALMIFFVACHVLCCVFIAITRSIGDDTTEPLLGIDGILSDDNIMYLAPLYWAILTLSGQLSGASVPELDTHLFLLQVAVLVGLPLYTVVLSTIGNAVQVEDAYTRYLDKIDVLRSFFEYTGLSKDFESEVLDYYKHLYTTTGTLDITENPLDDLPTELSIPVVIAMGSDMLKAVPIFKDASANMEFVHELTIKLVPRVIEPLAVVMRKGDMGAEMYFITFGNFNIVIDTGKVVFTLSKGNFFGEIALLHSGKRTATIMNSHRFGNVLVLDKESFQEVARFFPECLSQVYKAAEDRIRQTKENEQKEKEAADKAAKEAKEAREAKEKEEALAKMQPVPLGQEAFSSPRPQQGSKEDSMDIRNDDSATPRDGSYAKPMSPPGNDPVRASMEGGMDTSQMTREYNAIGYALSVSPEVYANVPVIADTTFDNETRPPRPSRVGDRSGGRPRHISSFAQPNEGGSTSGSGAGNPTTSDFDDEEDDMSSTTRSNSVAISRGSESTNTTNASGLPPMAPSSHIHGHKTGGGGGAMASLPER